MRALRSGKNRLKRKGSRGLAALMLAVSLTGLLAVPTFAEDGYSTSQEMQTETNDESIETDTNGNDNRMKIDDETRKKLLEILNKKYKKNIA